MGREARVKKQQPKPEPPTPAAPVTLATSASLRAAYRPEVAVAIEGTNLSIMCRPPDLTRLWAKRIITPELVEICQTGRMEPQVLEMLDHWCVAAAVRPRVVYEEKDVVEGESVWVGDLPLNTRYAMFGIGFAGADSKPNSLAPFVPTPPAVVSAMLEMARVTDEDIVCDVGSGDGRIVVAAAKLGAKSVGIDYDTDRIAEAKAAAKAAGVSDRVKFLHQDATKTLNVAKATVVTLYLLQGSNLKLRDTLRRQLQPGARVVSHAFTMGDWTATAEQTVMVDNRRYSLYLWEIPGKAKAVARSPEPSNNDGVVSITQERRIS